MNLYRSIGRTHGSPEALDLAERLSSWHDAMVAHERRMPESRCDDECPHAEADGLWREALELFGDSAHELAFLASRAAGPNRASAARLEARA